VVRNFILVLIIAGAAAAVPVLYREHPQIFEAALRMAVGGNAPGQETAEAVAEPEDEPVRLSGRKVRINAARNGHFLADFKLNGRRVPAIIDTGATLVAINESTARRIGIHLGPADFKYTASTANGTTKAAAATIDRLQIGRITMENVNAAVLQDDALSGTLIGMSFLQRLSHYSVEDGALVLQQ
jgi:aspartyl protease family protein